MAKTNSIAAITVDDLNAVREKLWRAMSMCRMLNTAMTVAIESCEENEEEQAFHDVRNMAGAIEDVIGYVQLDFDNLEARLVRGRKSEAAHA